MCWRLCARDSFGKNGDVIGFSIVTVTTADVTGVEVTIRRDVALTGQFRMESDNPAPVWPPHITISAYLALDGMPMMPGTGADGAPGGKFVLRNAFGPCVLRAGYSLAPGHSWWPARVLLDGVDITDVPTDFSLHENGRLVVGSRSILLLAGTVTDEQGRPIADARMVAFPSDRKLWQERSNRYHVAKADAQGQFRFAALPGQCLVRALPPDGYTSKSRLALNEFERLAVGAERVDVEQRELKTLRLTISDDEFRRCPWASCVRIPDPNCTLAQEVNAMRKIIAAVVGGPMIVATSLSGQSPRDATVILVPLKEHTAPPRLTSPEHGVRFDLDGDGRRDQIAWTEAGADRAFLALDRNSNGKIDNGTELIGSYTVPDIPLGLNALTSLNQGGPSTPKRGPSVTLGDPLYNKLLLWRDTNHNGISERSELRPASELISHVGLGGRKPPKGETSYKVPLLGVSTYNARRVCARVAVC